MSLLHIVEEADVGWKLGECPEVLGDIDDNDDESKAVVIINCCFLTCLHSCNVVDSCHRGITSRCCAHNGWKYSEVYRTLQPRFKYDADPSRGLLWTVLTALGMLPFDLAWPQ